MRDDQAIDLFPEYISGTLSKWTRFRLHRHLSRCSRCRTELESYRRLDSRLRSQFELHLDGLTVSPELIGGVETTIVSAGGRQRRSVLRLLPLTALSLLFIGLALWIVFNSTATSSVFEITQPVHGRFEVFQNGMQMSEGTFTYSGSDEWSQLLNLSYLPNDIPRDQIRFGNSAQLILSDEDFNALAFLVAQTNGNSSLVTVDLVFNRLMGVPLVKAGKYRLNDKELSAYRVQTLPDDAYIAPVVLVDRTTLVAVIVDYTNADNKAASITMYAE